MDYTKLYSTLINHAINNPPIGIAEQHQDNSNSVAVSGPRLNEPSARLERHHIIPRSMGGKDDAGNIVLLTPKQHYIAHLLLFKMGYQNQIFSVECFLNDSINVRSHRFGLFRWKKWIRRAVSYQRAINLRVRAKQELNRKLDKRIAALNREYQATLDEIERRYAFRMTDALFDHLESADA